MENSEKDMKKRLWRLIYPYLTYSGIMYVLTQIAMTIIKARLVGEFSPEILFSDSEELWYMATQECFKYVVLLQGIAALIALPILLFYFRKDTERRDAAGIVKQPADRAPIWMFLVLVFGAIAAYAGNGMIALSGLNQVDTEFDEIAEMIYQGNIVLEIVSLGVLVPIVEELIFRGLMYNQLTEVMKKKYAVIFTALVFGAYHGNLLQGIYATALGLLMIYVYERFRTLVAPILFHIGANTFGILLTETTVFNFLHETTGALYASVIVFSLLVIGVCWLVEKRNERREIVENHQEQES